MVRHQLYHAIKEIDENKSKDDRETFKEKFIAAMDKLKDEYDQQFKMAMDLYDVKPVEGENRSNELFMNEAFLDLYSETISTDEGD